MPLWPISNYSVRGHSSVFPDDVDDITSSSTDRNASTYFVAQKARLQRYYIDFFISIDYPSSNSHIDASLSMGECTYIISLRTERLSAQAKKVTIRSLRTTWIGQDELDNWLVIGACSTQCPCFCLYPLASSQAAVEDGLSKAMYIVLMGES